MSDGFSLPYHFIKHADPAHESLFNLELYLVFASILSIVGIVYFNARKSGEVAELLVYLGALAIASAALLPVMWYPYFFEAKGEILLATVPLTLIAFPFVTYGAVSILKDFVE